MISLLLLVTTLLTFATDSSTPPALKVETQLLGGKYCAGDDEVATHLMRLRVRYTNTSAKPIILYKGSNVVTTVMVSKSAADAVARRHELSLPLTTYQASGRPLSETTRLDNRFVILRKGASFETTVEVAVPFAKKGEAPAGTVAAGEHFLQVQLATWPESAELAETLRKRWRLRGYLWSGITESGPMRFKIDNQVQTINCH